MRKNYDDSRVRLLSESENLFGNGHMRKISIYSTWLKYILPCCIVILIIVFVVLTYIGFEEKVSKNDYSKAIDLGVAQKPSENPKSNEISNILTSVKEEMKTIFSADQPNQKPFFEKHPKAANLQCDRLFGNNSNEYIKKIISKNTRARIKYTDENNLKIDCDSIKKRNYFPITPRNDEEENFPLAFARIVYTDYLFLEMELAASYSPQNYYCYMIDIKSPPIFHERVENLAKCFSNVITTKREFDVNNLGHNMAFSHIECLKALISYKWKYVMLLQNHDSLIKTNFEIVQIFKWFNGANDVETSPALLERVDLNLNWTFQGLGLFKNASKNLIGAKGFPPKLNWGKGYVEVSLSREMVDFMILDLNLTKLLQQLEAKNFGIDEILVPTLQVTDALDAPGGFTHACLDRNVKVQHITRKSIWYDPNKCGTKTLRHAICVFGMEDLDRLPKFPELFVNKFLPDLDFGAITCWYEYMFNRTYLEEPNVKNLRKDYYLQLPHVRFHREKLKNYGTVDLNKFNCSIGSIY